MEHYDFGGYATKAGVLCADGRTIRKGAFEECDGQTVPLVWQHQHNEPFNVLGHALLEYRDGDVYTYGKFNNTESGRMAKEIVNSGDVKALSIYANQLKQKKGDVLHGVIREVSLCLGGANPGAYIDTISLEHAYDGEDDSYEDGEAYIYNGDNIELAHAADDADEKEEKKEEKPMAENSEKTVRDVVDSMSEEQKNVLYYLVSQALDDTGDDEEDEGDDDEMKQNVFDRDNPQNSLSHDDFKQIMTDAKRLGSLKDAVQQHMENGVLAHAVFDRNNNEVTYGIADIDYLFPEHRELNNPPEFIQREMTWVDKVMAGVHHTPFSRIRTTNANITMDEARARGYIKGNKKKEEVFTLLRRTTDPTTVYKKQKLDRDDIVDITDFDVVAWLKSEMRFMLNEELARAYLIGDGRLGSDEDKIAEDHIRPIWTDDDLYSVKFGVTAGANAEATAKNFIKQVIKARKDYKGSGTPTLFTTEDWLTEMLLIEDGIGHRLYKTEAELATSLRVKEIVTVAPMENQVRNGNELMGIVVNLNDYNVGADKGGAVSMFEDFDIDYNQQKYLIETRCSGALTKPFSALVFEKGATTPTYTAVTPSSGDDPSDEGWYEKQGAIYVPSTDTEVNSKKTYYEKA